MDRSDLEWQGYFIDKADGSGQVWSRVEGNGKVSFIFKYLGVER